MQKPEAGRRMDDAEMLSELTTPELAKQLWRSASPAGKQLREEFDRDEGSFLAYVGALHERNRGGSKAAKA